MTQDSPVERNPRPVFHIVARGVSDVGLERKNNEDDYHIDEAGGFFVVCDGMGGHASGEIASHIAVETMVHFVTHTVHQEGFRFPFSSPEAMTPEARVLDSAVRLANRSVYAEAQTDERHKGMGTTIVGVLAGRERVGVVHVGDSRVYLWRKGALSQVTEDHSLLNHYRRTRPMSDEEIRNFKGKNVIVRAVGLRDAVQPEVQGLDVEIGDVLLLCTDGLSDLVDDDAIAAVLAETGADLQLAIDKLLAAALAAGGKDNVTVMALQVVAGPPPEREPKPESDAELSDDTSPGFQAAEDGMLWDQETMPSYELPNLPDGEARVVVAPELVDAATPRSLDAVSDEDVARAIAARKPGHDSQGKRIPPPPPPSAQAGDGHVDGPPPIPDDEADAPGDIAAHTPPARPAVPAALVDTEPHEPAPPPTRAELADLLAKTTPDAPRANFELDVDEENHVDTDTYDARELIEATRAQLPKSIFETPTEPDLPLVPVRTTGLPRTTPQHVEPAAPSAGAAAPSATPGGTPTVPSRPVREAGAAEKAPIAPPPPPREDRDTEPDGGTEPLRKALDPAVEATFRQSSVRRSVVSRTSRPPTAEMPFARKADDDERPTGDAGERPELAATAKYSAVRPPSAAVVVGDADADVDDWNAPTMTMTAVSHRHEGAAPAAAVKRKPDGDDDGPGSER